MIARIVHLYIDKKNKEDFLKMFESRKDMIRNFEGCSYLNLLLVEHEDCSQFSTFSHWESEEHLNKYRSSNVFGQVWPRTKKWMVKKPKAQSFSLVEVLP